MLHLLAAQNSSFKKIGFYSKDTVKIICSMLDFLRHLQFVVFKLKILGFLEEYIFLFLRMFTNRWDCKLTPGFIQNLDWDREEKVCKV